jgi:hypothetical protein
MNMEPKIRWKNVGSAVLAATLFVLGTFGCVGIYHWALWNISWYIVIPVVTIGLIIFITPLFLKVEEENDTK